MKFKQKPKTKTKCKKDVNKIINTKIQANTNEETIIKNKKNEKFTSEFVYKKAKEDCDVISTKETEKPESIKVNNTKKEKFITLTSNRNNLEDMSEEQTYAKMCNINTVKYIETRYYSKKEPIVAFRKIYKKLHFSKQFSKLSDVYSAILTVQRFNKQKSMKNIYRKCKKSIEVMIKDTMCIKHLEQINFFVKGEYKKINLTCENKDVSTFTFEFNDCDFDNMIWCYICEEYEKYLAANNIEHNGDKFANGFDAKKICDIPRKRLFDAEQNIEDDSKSMKVKCEDSNNVECRKDSEKEVLNVPLTAKDKANAILQRIKEKERKRKEEFVKMQNMNDEFVTLKNKIDTLFRIENKTKLPIEKVIKTLKLFNGRKSIENLCTIFAEYSIRLVSDELFLCKIIL